MDEISKQDRDSQTVQQILAFASQGIIHLQFTDPTFIKNTQAAIGDTHIDAQFPLDETDTITDLMGISDLSIIFKDSKIIYHLAVALIKPYGYTLYEVSPLPKLQKYRTYGRNPHS
jgi:hypothetical protein